MSKKFTFKIVKDPDDSEVEDNEDDDKDTALEEDEDLQAYLREMREQEQRRAATYVPPSTGARSKTTMSSVSQPQMPSQAGPSAQPPAPQPQPPRRWERIRTPSTYSVPPVSPTLPERSTSAGEWPTFVKRYRDFAAGELNLDKMREDSMQIPGSNQDIARVLSMKSRAQTKEVSATDHGRDKKKDKRMQKELKDEKGFKEEKFQPYKSERDKRWHPPLKLHEQFPFYRHQPLRPQRSPAPDQSDRRFHRSISDMGREFWKSGIMPTGRMGYGDISEFDLNEMRRSLEEAFEQGRTMELAVKIPGVEHEDPEHWTPRQLAFSHRLRRMNPQARRTYFEMQQEANPHLPFNSLTEDRMTPRPTRDYLRKADDQRAKAIKRSMVKRSSMSREDRRSDQYRRSILPSAIMRTTPIQKPIPEDSEEYKYETFKVDPKTKFIATPRRVHEWTQRQALNMTPEEYEKLKRAQIKQMTIQEQEEENRRKLEENRRRMQSFQMTQMRSQQQSERSRLLQEAAQHERAFLQEIDMNRGSFNALGMGFGTLGPPSSTSSAAPSAASYAAPSAASFAAPSAASFAAPSAASFAAPSAASFAAPSAASFAAPSAASFAAPSAASFAAPSAASFAAPSAASFAAPSAASSAAPSAARSSASSAASSSAASSAASASGSQSSSTQWLPQQQWYTEDDELE